MSARRRLDVELVRRGLADTRERAQGLIATGRVRVAGTVADKPSRLVAAGDPVFVIAAARSEFVGRGGVKLAAALDHFGIDPSGWRCLDAGASTGGFTDCLLQRGASSVVAVDVGYGQLHERVRSDPRVEVRERTNVRHLGAGDIGAAPRLVVADLSFISLVTVMDALLGACAAEGELIVLVKPQFEAGREVVSRGRGVVRDPAVWIDVLERVRSAVRARGAAMMGVMRSPITGADGNVEFLAHLVPQAEDPALDLVEICAPGRE